MTTQRGWRGWLTHHLLDRWLINGRYYQLHLVHGDHKNPEYRIADDIRLATDSRSISPPATTAVLSAATFIAVLGDRRLAIVQPRRHRDHHSGPVVAAVAYAVVASGSMVFIGHRSYIGDQSAEFRYVLTRLSENGELLSAGRARSDAVEQLVDHGVDTAGATSAFKRCGRRSSRKPALHRAGSADHPVRAEISRRHDVLGQVMQAASAFTIVQAAFVGWSTIILGLRIGLHRPVGVSSLMVSLDNLERAESGDGVGRIERRDAAGAAAPLSIFRSRSRTAPRSSRTPR